VKYRQIEVRSKEYPKRLMCRVLQVTSQGYHQWKRVEERRTTRAQDDRMLLDRIRVAHADSRRTYGRIRITDELCDSGMAVNEKRVGRLMRSDGIRAKAARKFKATTDSSHSQPVAPNTLDRDFLATAPNQKWVGDITYIWTNEGWLYLAVVIDLFSRRVVGWSLQERMTSELVCAAMRMAARCRGCVATTLCHFDRGSQYASDIFQALLKRYGFECSMSRKGNCWDNAVAESFFHSLKVEAIHGENFRTRDEARRAIFDWLECFYNVKRRHSSLGSMSPFQFETKNLVEKKAA
jgi:transposase InsO family protein